MVAIGGTPRFARAARKFACLLTMAVVAPLAQSQSLGSLSAHAGPGASPAAATAPAEPRGVFPPWPNEGWTDRAPMAAARWAHASVSYSTGDYPDNASYLYAITGYDGTFALTNRMSRLDVDANTWSDLAPVPTPVGQVSAARIGDRIFMPGGYSGSFSPTGVLQIYDITNNTWSTGANLPQAVGDYAIGVSQDRYVYVVGGYTGSFDTNRVQVYDTLQNTWADATPKPGSAAAGLRGAVAGGKFVVTGGYSQALAASLSDTWIGTIDPSDPLLITWVAGPAYPGGTAGRLAAGAPEAAGPGAGSAALDVVLFTGGDPNGQGLLTLAGTWLFDVVAGSWHALPDKPTAVSNINQFVGIASDGKLFMASTGGYDGSAVVSVDQWLGLGLEALPDLSVTVSDGGATVSPGDTQAYSIEYANAGPGFAQAVVLTATVPAGAVADLVGSTAGWSCAPDANAGAVCTLPLGDLIAGPPATATLALTAVSPVPAGVTDITLQASIATTTPEDVTTNNSGSDTTPFTTGQVVAITGNGLATAEDGSTATFELSLTEEPLEPLTVTLASDTPGEGTVSAGPLVFTAADWSTPRTVTVTGADDALDDGDVGYQITFAISGGGGNYAGAMLAPVAVVNVDDDHTLTLATVGSGSVTADPQAATYETGQSVMLTANAAPGWTFSGWSGDAAGLANPLSVTITADTTITASFTQDQYTVSVTTAGSGSVAIDPPGGLYTFGQSIVLTATPEPGWTFAGWSGSASGTTNPLTLEVDGPAEITATFTQDEYPVTASTVGSGSVAIDPPGGNYTLGQDITLTATPADGWIFAGWSGDASGTVNPLPLEVTGPTAITATFTQAQHPVTVATVGSGSVAVDPPGASFVEGTSITLTASAADGWTFAGWSGDAGGTTNPLTLEVTGPLAITATFTQDVYPVTVTTVGSGSVALDPAGGSYTFGQTVTLTATPADGWSFAGWAGDATGAANPLSLEVTGAAAVTATFVPTQATVDLQTQGNGSVQVSPQQEGYAVGDVVTLTAIPAEGWIFTGWTGDLQTSTNPLVITLQGDVSLVATFGLAQPAPAATLQTIPSHDWRGVLAMLLGVFYVAALTLGRERR